MTLYTIMTFLFIVKEQEFLWQKNWMFHGELIFLTIKIHDSFEDDRYDVALKYCIETYVAAHESEDNSNHVVVLPRSIKTVRLQVM